MIPRTVVVAVIMVAGPHCHTPNGGINSHLCGRGNNGVAIAIPAAANKPTKMVRMFTSLDFAIWVNV